MAKQIKNQKTLGEVELLEGLMEGALIFCEKKSYIYKHLALANIGPFETIRYYICIDAKSGQLVPLTSDAKVTVLQ